MTVNSTAAASVTMGQSTKGNPVVRVGNLIINRACASDMLAVLDDPTSVSTFRGLLVELVGLQAVAMAEKASKAADKIEKATPPTVPPVVVTPPAAPCMSTSETVAAIAASLDVVKQDRQAMRGAPVPQRLPASVPDAVVNVSAAPVSDASERAALIAEGKSLGMPAVSAYGLKMDLGKLRDKVSAARKPVSPAPAKPAVVTPPAPMVPTRTLLGQTIFSLADGRDCFVSVYSDGNHVVEIDGDTAAAA